MNKCHTCCILSREFSGMRKNDEKPQKEQFRSNGFRQWKAESQEDQVRTMESRIAGVSGSDNGKLNRRSIRFGQWKAGSQGQWVQTTESWIAGVSDSDDGKPESSEGTEG